MQTLKIIGSDTIPSQSMFATDAVKIHEITEYMSWIEIDITPDEDLSIQISDGQNKFMHFIYNLKDAFVLSTNERHSKKKLVAFQSGIMHQKKGLDTFLHFKKNGKYQLCLVQFAKFNEENEVNDFFLQFEAVFKAMSETYYFMHTGLPNLSLGEYVKLLMEMPKSSLSQKLMASGYIHIMLGIKLRQYLEYMNNPLPASVLTLSELQRIQRITDLIHKNPEDNYSIDELCKEWGLSANKLQIGFREMHGKTVCNFVNHIRLLKAEELLKSTDLNVSQIVYSLGWSSRSYFCKIFKEKYQCTPKNYQLLLVNAS